MALMSIAKNEKGKKQCLSTQEHLPGFVSAASKRKWRSVLSSAGLSRISAGFCICHTRLLTKASMLLLLSMSQHPISLQRAPEIGVYHRGRTEAKVAMNAKWFTQFSARVSIFLTSWAARLDFLTCPETRNARFLARRNQTRNAGEDCFTFWSRDRKISSGMGNGYFYSFEPATDRKLNFFWGLDSVQNGLGDWKRKIFF